MKLLIEGTKIIGIMPSHPEAIEVEVPNDFSTTEKPLWAWEYINGEVVFSQSTIDEALGATQKVEYQTYLNSTDWYVIRMMERGIEIPQDISDLRMEAINFIDTH